MCSKSTSQAFFILLTAMVNVGSLFANLKHGVVLLFFTLFSVLTVDSLAEETWTAERWLLVDIELFLIDILDHLRVEFTHLLWRQFGLTSCRGITKTIFLFLFKFKLNLRVFYLILYLLVGLEFKTRECSKIFLWYFKFAHIRWFLYIVLKGKFTWFIIRYRRHF